MSLLACPVCKSELLQAGGALKCKNGHSFDLSSKGYVNLLLSNKKFPGDSAEMVAARHAFLEKGYYACLRDALAKQVLELSRQKSPVIVDAGCGEGYYTAGVYSFLKAGGVQPSVIGFDISKPAVKIAARRGEELTCAVAGIFDMPLQDESADVVLNVFAPCAGEEFYRVLKPGGSLVIVEPGKKHLFGLKKLLYEDPYDNAENDYGLRGFQEKSVTFAGADIILDNQQDIQNLFKMTPYYWKTSELAVEKLSKCELLETRIEFEIHVLDK